MMWPQQGTARNPPARILDNERGWQAFGRWEVSAFTSCHQRESPLAIGNSDEMEGGMICNQHGALAPQVMEKHTARRIMHNYKAWKQHWRNHGSNWLLGLQNWLQSPSCGVRMVCSQVPPSVSPLHWGRLICQFSWGSAAAVTNAWCVLGESQFLTPLSAHNSKFRNQTMVGWISWKLFSRTKLWEWLRTSTYWYVPVCLKLTHAWKSTVETWYQKCSEIIFVSCVMDEKLRFGNPPSLAIQSRIKFQNVMMCFR